MGWCGMGEGMRARMSRAGRFGQALALGLVALLAAANAGCALLTNAPPTTNPGTHVIAWIRQDASDTAQIWASVDDAPPRQITHRPASASSCGEDILGAPMYAPDLRHIAVAGGTTCASGQIAGQLFVVDAATGALSTVPLPGSGILLTTQRSYGWVDAHTLFALGNFGGDSGSASGGVEYTLGASSTTALPGLPANIAEGVARGTTLFYVTASQTTGPVPTPTITPTTTPTPAHAVTYTLYHTLLARYDLSAQTPLPGTVDLGTFAMCACPTGDYHLPGWDASPDGTHIAYQRVTPVTPTSAQNGIGTQAFFYAASDGSGASQILKALVTTARVRMRFSPDGTMVAITEAFNSPDVASGCVNSIGLFGDPCMQFYGPDAYAYPAWHFDSKYLIAATAPAIQAPASSLYRDTPSRFHGVVYAALGYNPWSTP